MFRVPANTPIAIQPIDTQGRAVQVMRSWCTAMPGEKLSCIGCHEQQNATAPPKAALASLKPAVEITPWYGPARPFGFMHEVQVAITDGVISSRIDRVVVEELPGPGKDPIAAPPPPGGRRIRDVGR